MKNFKKKTCMLIIASTVGLSSTSFATPYTIKSGDSFWKISNQFNVSLESVFKANNANENTVIYPGQVIEVPSVGKGTKKTSRNIISREMPKTIVHTVVSGDSLWTLSNKYYVSIEEILKDNSDIDEDTVLQVGQKLNIPASSNSNSVVNNVISTDTNKTVEGEYGEYLNWFDEVNSILPIGTVFKVTDFNTGKSFTMKRTIGSFHADCEALTLEDTEIIKGIWGGFSWVRRPVIVQTGDRLIAASMTAMPHAGVDSEEGGKHVEWRSGDYGAGANYDYVKGNGMDGHVDIHFAGSKRHKDGAVDQKHQECIKIAAGKTNK